MFVLSSHDYRLVGTQPLTLTDLVSKVNEGATKAKITLHYFKSCYRAVVGNTGQPSDFVTDTAQLQRGTPERFMHSVGF